jgi:hypothetical protein
VHAKGWSSSQLKTYPHGKETSHVSPAQWAMAVIDAQSFKSGHVSWQKSKPAGLVSQHIKEDVCKEICQLTFVSVLLLLCVVQPV